MKENKEKRRDGIFTRLSVMAEEWVQVRKREHYRLENSNREIYAGLYKYPVFTAPIHTPGSVLSKL